MTVERARCVSAGSARRPLGSNVFTGSDIYVVRLESALTDAETVLRMMDGRHARAMGLLVLLSERILFRSRRRFGPNFSVPLEEVVAIEAYTRRGTGTVRLITPDGSLTVDQILGRQGEMLGDDAQATVLGESLPDWDPGRCGRLG